MEMLKLGSGTGSLINHVMSAANNNIQPEIGMGVTFLSWTDRSPGTIVEINTLKNGVTEIVVQEDKYKRIDKNGFSESQEYEYTPNPEAFKKHYRLIDGKWVRYYFANESNRWRKDKDDRIVVGRREKFHDFTF
jgi:hypothetical protein